MRHLAAAAVGGFTTAYGISRERRLNSYTPAQACVNFPDLEEVDEFLHDVGAMQPQALTKTSALPKAVHAFRREYRAIEPTLKTGDVILYASSPISVDPFHYKMMGIAQEWMSPPCSAGKMTHASMVVVVPEQYRTGDGPGVLLLDCAEGDTLYGATDRLVAHGKGPERKSIHLVQAERRLESYIGSNWVLPLEKPLSPAQERRLWQFVLGEYRRNPRFDVWHLMGAGLRGAFPAWFQNSEDWTEMFCSELIVAAFKVARVVDPAINTSLYQPAQIEGLGLFGPPVRMMHFDRLDDSGTLLGPVPEESELTADEDSKG